MVRRVYWVAMAALMLGQVAAQAADMDPPIDIAADDVAAGGVYGNVHASAFGSFSGVGNNSAKIPGFTIGGKIAGDSNYSPWGWQVDGDYSYSDFNWISPSIDDVNGHISASDSAAHLTYRPNGTSKLGLYAGYGTINLTVEDTSGGTFDLFDDTGLTEASVTLGMAGIGIEGLTELNDSTWVQGRLGLVDPIYLSATINDGTTKSSDSATDILGENIGATVGASLHHRLTDNINLRAEGSYVLFGAASDAKINILSVAAGANYNFGALPLSLGVTGGYSFMDVDGSSSDGFSASTKLTYSFGGPSVGSTGKLFRSGAIGLTPN